MDTTNTTDYGEPWKPYGQSCIRDRMDFFVKPNESTDRIIACVNACHGMADPAKEIAEMREAIKAAHAAIAAIHKPLGDETPHAGQPLLLPRPGGGKGAGGSTGQAQTLHHRIMNPDENKLKLAIANELPKLITKSAVNMPFHWKGEYTSFENSIHVTDREWPYLAHELEKRLKPDQIASYQMALAWRSPYVVVASWQHRAAAYFATIGKEIA